MVVFGSLCLFASLASAQPNYGKLSSALYPNSRDDQAFTSKFFEIVEADKTADPLLEGRGPSIRDYSLDKIKFSFVTNVTETTVDLVLFNWTLPVFQGLELNQALSDFYGSNVYTLKNIGRKTVASQGRDQSQLTNFSYMFGANYMEKQIKKDTPPDYQVPEEYLNWKPNPEYMDRSAPLRQALDSNNLVMLSPSKEVFFEGIGMQTSMRPFMEIQFAKKGGFQNMIMGMMVHEMFHVKEGEDQANGLASERKISIDRNALVQQLQTDARLRSLIAAYVNIVFALSDGLKSATAPTKETEQLSDLKTIVGELKKNYSEAWKFVWNFEYTEGFADYVSAYSMIQVGVTTLSQKIDLEKSDDANNFTYRTGAFGGLYLARRLKQMPFANNEDHQESVWEIILRLGHVSESSVTPDQLVSKYSDASGVSSDNEIKRVTDYLISTVTSIK